MNNTQLSSKRYSGLYLLAAIVFFLHLPQITTAEGFSYTPNCPFVPEINPINYTFELKGTYEDSDELVPSTEAVISYDLKTLGNLSNLANSININLIFRCNGNDTGISGSYNLGNPSTYKIKNGSTVSEFKKERRFFIPEGAKYCDAMIDHIYFENYSWEQKTGFEGISKCFIKTLSQYVIYGDVYANKTVLTPNDFYAKKQIEEQKKQNKYNIFLVFLSTLFGGIIVHFSSSKLQERAWKREERTKRISDLYGPIYDELIRIKELVKIEGYVGYLGGWDELKRSHRVLLFDEGLKNCLEKTVKKITDYAEKGFNQNDYGDLMRKEDQDITKEKKELIKHIEKALSLIENEIKL